MKAVLPVFLVCAACAPSLPGHGEAIDTAEQRFATQTTAPSPDYRILLGQPGLGGEGGKQREATAPAPSNARTIGETWLARLKGRDALLGYGLVEPGGAVNSIDTGLTQEEFDRWAQENDWSVPTHIRWTFASKLNLPSVSEAARESVRVWPASTARTGMQNQALYRGRIELRDGCFFVGEIGKPADKLAWFDAEMGLDIDPAGYFILRNRISGQTLARLGEDMNWAGPASAQIDKESERALRKACGPNEIMIVGSPESRERFLTNHPHLRGKQTPQPSPPTAK